ncbi:MAG: family ATPase [Crocinitomicaceae bacterium]|jgi:predicted ATP-binding protein involved in virulence|nr:family ATPase [Crocinitomicaceae bacterium]
MENKIHPFFLEKVSLSGYKSIYNVDVNFNKGLNIIIGKNAVGKTNFLDFLSHSLQFNFDDITNFSSSLFFKNGKTIQIEISDLIDNKELLNNSFINRNLISKISIDGNLINQDLTKKSDAFDIIESVGLTVSSSFIKHGIPNLFPLVDIPYSFRIDGTGIPNDFFKIINDEEQPYFIKAFLADFLFSFYRNRSETINIEKINAKINDSFQKLEKIKPTLAKYSPIGDLRLNKNYNVYLDDRDEFIIENLLLEFKIDGKWFPFSNLSDGTKRIFYIISEIDYSSTFYSTNDGFGFNEDTLRVILLEEPELGIHPHQLMQLMQFIKEKSSEKQIILTTHSPIILDILENDELNKIIIASYNNNNLGTQFRHLNKDEIFKAKKYLEEDYLGDYWKYSDLEQ